MAKVLCVLYDDPAAGYPPPYARDDLGASSALTQVGAATTTFTLPAPAPAAPPAVPPG